MIRYPSFQVAPGVVMTWEIKVSSKTVEMAIARIVAKDMIARPGVLRIVLDPSQTPIAPFYKPQRIGFVNLDFLLHAPDYGQACFSSEDKSFPLVAFNSSDYAANRFWSHLDFCDEQPSRSDRLVELKPGLFRGRFQWSIERVVPLVDIVNREPRLKGLSRYSLSGLQFRPDSHVSSNSIASINCCFCMFETAMFAQFLPKLPGNNDACELLRTSLDTFFAGTPGHDTGNLDIHNPAFNTPVDTKPAMIFAAWTVIRKTGDLEQLKRWLPDLEHLANLMAETDEDGDGLLETVKSTRSGGWYDVVWSRDKCAYGNALGFKAFQYMADLEQLLGRQAESKKYADLAEKIKTAYFSTFFNPATRIVAGWKTKDGVLHDYWFPWLNGMAIVFGLVPETEADEILGRIQAKFKEVRYDAYKYGLPNCLVEIPKPDYGVPGKFQHYLNGGASPCFAYWYIQALYQTGRRAEADAILWPLVQSYNENMFNGGFGLGRGDNYRQEWHTWDGQRCGGEGFLIDAYLAVNVIYNGYFGIVFDRDGYKIAPWSPLKGKEVPLHLNYMGKDIKSVK